MLLLSEVIQPPSHRLWGIVVAEYITEDDVSHEGVADIVPVLCNLIKLDLHTCSLFSIGFFWSLVCSEVLLDATHASITKKNDRKYREQVCRPNFN